MNKKSRIAIFHIKMKECAPSNSPNSALKTMQDVLATIENENVPPDTEHMTILHLGHKDVRPYGNGGFAIPLIGYMIFINSNGAIGIRDDWNGGFSLQLPGSDGLSFTPVPDWRYKFE